MAFGSILRRGSVSIFPLAIRSVPSPTRRLFQYRMVSSDVVGRQFIPFLRFSTAANSEKRTADVDTLVRAIESEIKFREQNYVPYGFPFTIEDVSRCQISLKRKYHDEIIEVFASALDCSCVGDVDDHHHPNLPPIHITFTISKGDDVLNFTIFITNYPNEIDEIPMNYMSITSSGHGLHLNIYDMDKNLQNAFRKYLEIRGMKLSLITFFLDLFGNDEHKINYLPWLKNLKVFMEL